MRGQGLEVLPYGSGARVPSGPRACVYPPATMGSKTERTLPQGEEASAHAPRRGGRARMVDVGDKPITARRAEAAGRVLLPSRPSGSSRSSAWPRRRPGRGALAGIQAGKRTSEWIPARMVPLDLPGGRDRAPAPRRGRPRCGPRRRRAGPPGWRWRRWWRYRRPAWPLYDMAKGSTAGSRSGGRPPPGETAGRSGRWRRPD